MAAWLVLAALPGCAIALRAGEIGLQPDTLAAWNAYLRSAESRVADRGAHDPRKASPFLWVDEDPGRVRQVRAGEIVVAPLDGHAPRSVPHGLIHDWIGAAFIPNASLDDLFAVIRDYGEYSKFYAPTAVESKEISHDGDRYTFHLTLVNRAVVLKTGLDTQNEAIYTRVGDKSWTCAVRALQIREIENPGQSGERLLPPDQGTGFIWRLASFSRFEERDGGVYVELEALALTRDIPVALRWIVNPMVRSISRGSLAASLRQSSQAVEVRLERAGKSPVPGHRQPVIAAYLAVSKNR